MVVSRGNDDTRKKSCCESKVCSSPIGARFEARKMYQLLNAFLQTCSSTSGLKGMFANFIMDPGIMDAGCSDNFMCDCVRRFIGVYCHVCSLGFLSSVICDDG